MGEMTSKYQEEENSRRRGFVEEDPADSGLGSRSDTAENFDPDLQSEYEESEAEEVVPVRGNKWYPSVGQSAPPDLTHVKGKTDSVNRKYKPKSARRVEISNDT